MKVETFTQAANLLDLVEGDPEPVLVMMLAIHSERRRQQAKDLMAIARVRDQALAIAQAQRVVA